MVELQKELATYEHRLPGMLAAHRDHYVVIRGNQALHFSLTYEDALEWGYSQFGLDKFFVKKVAEDGDVAHFTRDLGPCRT